MRKIFIHALVLMVCLGCNTIEEPVVNNAAAWTISNANFTFTPGLLTITKGDSVNFNLADSHNVVEVSLATWNANGNELLPGFSLPFGGGVLHPSQLSVGTHYYVCTLHSTIGMKGIIVVK